jgi:hypothetical protein
MITIMAPIASGMTRARAGPGEWVDPLLKVWAAEAGCRRGLASAEAFKRMVF